MFDLSWFTSIPGLLITCGVILLLIALIIFIVTSVKAKKEKKHEMELQREEEPVAVVPPIEAVESSANTAPEQPIAEEPVAAPEVAPVVTPSTVTNESNPVSEKPVEAMPADPMPEPVVAQAAPVNEEPAPIPAPDDVVGAIDQVNYVPTPEEPKVDTVPEVNKEPKIPEPVKATSVMDEVLDMPDANPVDLEKTSVSIYGGANPFVGPISEPEHRPIYGGADPLEKTQQFRPVEMPQPEVSPIIPEVTLTDTKPEPEVTPSAPSAVVEPTPDYTVQQEEVKPVPVEINEDIEQL